MDINLVGSSGQNSGVPVCSALILAVLTKISFLAEPYTIICMPVQMFQAGSEIIWA